MPIARTSGSSIWQPALRTVKARDVTTRYRDGCEISLLDVREQWSYSRGHALLASSCPFSSLELMIEDLVPRKSAPIVVMDDGAGTGNNLAVRAAARLSGLGYDNVSVLAGGAPGWAAAGFALFAGVHAFSKLFGEVVEHDDAPPTLTADQLAEDLTQNAENIVIDVRPPEEFQRASLPCSINIPAGELLRSLQTIAPDANTPIVVHCGGRTRGIIAAQTLIAAGVPNPVLLLENGTIGWRLSGRDTVAGVGSLRRIAIAQTAPVNGQSGSNFVAASGAREIDSTGLADTIAQTPTRTTYFLDVRSRAEFDRGHHPRARHVPAGQLVQETDQFLATRNARLVLFDDAGDRAAFAAYWLRRMGWPDISWFFLADCTPTMLVTSVDDEPAPALPIDRVDLVTPAAAKTMLALGDAVIIDLSSSLAYEKGHVPGAHFAIRAQIRAETMTRLGSQSDLILTSEDGARAALASADISEIHAGRIRVLEGGNQGWRATGFALETGPTSMLHSPRDVRRSIYEGSSDLSAAMQGYIDWEEALVETAKGEDYLPFDLPKACGSGQ